MPTHLADLSHATDYEVNLEFTSPMAPDAIANGEIPLVSLATEIEADSLSETGAEIREQYGRIPYGSPLYWWEKHSGGETACLYIGQTIHMPLQDRFESHAKLVRLLCQFVNDATVEVFFRLCSRFDIHYSSGDQRQRYAIEHLPVDQAKEVIADVEAHLIFENQPEYNVHHKDERKVPWKSFFVRALTMR
jgi:hypothetical protein